MANYRLNDKVVLITGGAGGMGRAMVLAFAEEGAKGVVFIDFCKAETGRKVVAEAKKRTGENRVVFVRGDVTKPADCKKAVDAAVKTFGGVDVLINNAALGELATGRERLPFWKFDEKGFKRLMDVNLNGPFYMSKLVAPRMIKQGWGRILMLSKRCESMYAPFISAYGPSKAALDAMMMAWAVELMGTGVTVNSFNPGGAVDTDFMIPSVRKTGGNAGALLQPEVIIPAALFMASDRSDGITGCRFVSSKWDHSLPPRQAAEQARDPAIFRAPGRGERPSKLTKAFKSPAKPKAKRRKTGARAAK